MDRIPVLDDDAGHQRLEQPLAVGVAPVPADGHFRIGNIAKPMIATVVLQLAGEGRLSLDDTVEEHLPGVVTGNGNDGRTITIRQLLQHTSGLYDYAEDLLPPLLGTYEGYLAHRYDTYQLEELATIAMRHPPGFAPGTSWAYSNTGYVLAGLLIEQVTGNPWGQEVTSRIIEPLGLEHTTTGNGPGLPDPHAKGYQQFTPGGPLADATVVRWTSQAATSGGIVSTTPVRSAPTRRKHAGSLRTYTCDTDGGSDSEPTERPRSCW